MSSSPNGTSEPPIERTGGRVQANGITLAYQIYGPPDREVVLMIPGVGGQMGAGPDLLAEAVVRRGYRVIVWPSIPSGRSRSPRSARPRATPPCLPDVRRRS